MIGGGEEARDPVRSEPVLLMEFFVACPGSKGLEGCPGSAVVSLIVDFPDAASEVMITLARFRYGIYDPTVFSLSCGAARSGSGTGNAKPEPVHMSTSKLVVSSGIEFNSSRP